MSLEYRAVSAAARRFSLHLKTVAITRGLFPLSLLTAVSISGAERGLFPSTPGVRVSPARTAMTASADLVPSSPQGARAAHDRWQAAARRVCEEMQKRSGPAAVTPSSLCRRKSAGIAVHPKDGTNTESLLRNADVAMYFAKRRGPGTYAFFDPGMNAAAILPTPKRRASHEACR